ncbi:hemagglutinin repeat-containing protein [Paraburkholderia sacchari]|uniref:hemagglutinin repeat-containing protein n=1 Tax=Paraburkholderia sacchari TaxID=159450 RepID=UPI0039A5B622
MNNTSYRLVFSRIRGMLVAVEETATAAGKETGQTCLDAQQTTVHRALFMLRQIAFAACALFGALPLSSVAQIVPGGANAPQVQQTPNGLPLVQANRPGAAGVSLNTYGQFDVGRPGAIVNNASTGVQTQQAGYVGANPNYAPGQAARIIVNQVNSANPSQIRGYVEIAGPKAQLVIANPSGIVVDGGGFVNTSRAILTTGTPLLDANGALTGYKTTRGNIVVQGEGFNGANIDQVDLISRAVQVNAAIYANSLNVVAGAAQVNHDTLAATPIAGDGAPSPVSIDVSHLGGMYSGKILLTSNEHGVGVGNAGVISAQAGDLTLSVDGKLTLTGKTSARGNISATASGGIENSGTIYAQKVLSASTGGALANTGTIAAQQDVKLDAGSVASTGALAAGVGGDGTVTQTGNLSVNASGLLAANGQNIAGGNVALSGASADLSGSNTSASGNIGVAASKGDTNLKGATVTTSGMLTTHTGGKLTTDSASLSSGGAQTHKAGALSNVKGEFVSAATLDTKVSGAAVNTGGVMQSAGKQNFSAGSLDNTAGSILSLNGDGLNLGVTGAFINGLKSVIGSNGNVSISSYTFTNAGQVNALKNSVLKAWGITNSGSMLAGGALTASATDVLKNSGTLSATTTTVSGTRIDNSQGDINGVAVSVKSTGNLVNQAGRIAQSGTGAQTVSAGGTLDNSNGGKIATNANDLAIDAGVLVNDSGAVHHAGTGRLAITAASDLLNRSGQIATNGSLTEQAANVDNSGGSMTAQAAAQVAATGGIANRDGLIYGHDSLTASSSGDMDNTGGAAQTAGDLAMNVGGTLTNQNGAVTANGAHGKVNVNAGAINNTSGTMTNAGDGATAIAAGDIRNSAGVMGGNGDVTLSGNTLENDSGGQVVGAGVTNAAIAGSIGNQGGMMYGGASLVVGQAATAVYNDGGSLLGGLDVYANVGLFSNWGGVVRANRDIGASGAISGEGEMTAGRNLGLTVAGDYTNTANNHLNADGDLSLNVSGNLTNTGTLGAGGALTASGANVFNMGDMTSQATRVNAAYSINNQGRIEGDSVTTNSGSFVNTAGVIGNLVAIHAWDILNSGGPAVIAGAQKVGLYAQNSFTNEYGALVYSAGNIEIARDGARDGEGLLANQTGVITNSASTIEAEGDIDAAATTINNLRTGVDVQAGAPVSITGPTLTLWTADMGNNYAGREFAYFQSRTYPWRWWAGGFGAETRNSLATPITVKLPASQVTNLDTGAQTFSLTKPLTDQYQVLATGFATRTITNNPTQYYESLTQNPDGTVTITFWPDYDPNVHIRPDQVQVRTDLGPGNHDYVEIARTTTTTTQTDQLVSAGTGALMQAGGSIRTNTGNGSLNNYASTMAAGGDLIRRADGGSVDDTGVVLQQTGEQRAQSVFYWHQKSGRGEDQQTVEDAVVPLATVTTDAIAAIATGNQSVQTNAQDINITSVDRHGATVTGAGVSGGDATGTQLGSVSGSNRKPQTLGTASGGIPDLKLPNNALYTYVTTPGSDYLIETDPRFTNPQPVNPGGGAATGGGTGGNPAAGGSTAGGTTANTGGNTSGGGVPGIPATLPATIPATVPATTGTTSSNYLLALLGFNPQQVQKRLGDGYYEMQLIRNQVTQLTGRTYLGGYSDNLSEYTALMNNGAAYAKAFNLAVGVGLTDTQMQQLTTDMVWLVSQTVTLPDGSQQNVLVPKLYLAQSNTVELRDSGVLVAGGTVTQNATGTFSNSGHVVGDLATTVIGNTIVNRGVIGSGGTTTVATVGDVNNIGGRIGGVNTVVSAGRDINNVSVTQQAAVASGNAGFSSSATGMSVASVAAISGLNTTTATAVRDVNLNGSVITSKGDTAVAAGRDLNAETVTLTSTRDAGTTDGLNGGHAKQTVNAGSAITGAGNVTTVSGGNTTLTGSTIAAGKDAVMLAGGDMTVTAAKDTAAYNGQSMGGSKAQGQHSSFDESARGSSVSAVGNTTMAAGQNGSGNLNILGSSVTAATGATNLVATGDVNIGTVTETHDSQHWEHSESSGFLSSTKTTDTSNSHAVVSVGSTVAGDSVNGVAGHDMTITGSTVAATHDVNLGAAHDLTVTTSQDTSQGSTFHEEQKSGLGAMSGGGFSLNAGTREQKDTAHDASVTHNASLVGSTDGSVNMAAGNNLTVKGSDVIAAQNVTGTGATVTIEAAQGRTRHDESHEMKQSGFTVGLAGSVGDAINNAISETQAANNSSGNGDSRAAALHGIAAANDAFMGGAGVKDLASGGKPDIGVKISFGTSQSRSDASEDRTIHSGSSVQAGGTAAFVANNGDVTIAGSNVNANDVMLAAKNQVNVINTTDTDSTRSSNSSSSASVGVQYTLAGGFGVSASMSNAHGDANSDASIQNASHINGKNSATIISGGDANIIGSQVNGGKVVADVGGNLNIASVQDITSSAAHQSSSGGGFTISQGGGSASISAQNGHADGKYAGVNEQAGINAGAGGFDINVKGNTDLTGAVITSAADASKNSLSTGTLSFSDIANHSEYSASSNGISAGIGIANTGRAVGPGSVSNGGGVSPMLPQNESGSSDATTRSAVSAGTITVTDGAKQKQDVAGLSRDTVDTNGKVANTPDLNALLNQQADRMQAAQAAGQAVAQRIGDYAKAQYEATGDPAWKEGGDKRAAMQAAGAAVVAGLGGGIGSAVAGAAGAAIGSKMAPTLNELSGAIAASNPTEDTDVNKALGNIVANVVATGAGAAAGGAGAFSSSNVDLYNRQLHPDERQWAKDNASKFAQIYQEQTGQTLTADQAQQMLLASGYRIVDAAASAGPAPDGNKYATAFISQYGGDMFRATPAEYNSPFLYGNADHSLTPEQRALPGAIANPAAGLAIAGALAAPAVLPALAAIPGAPIFSTGGAMGSAALASANGVGAISAAISAGSQYVQTGDINWVNVAGAYITGLAGAPGGLLRNVAINAFGGAATTVINNSMQGKSDSITASALSSGVLSGLGYGIGKAAENGVNTFLRPGLDSSNWASTGVWTGSGWNLFRPNSTGVISGSVLGGMGQEATGAMIPPSNSGSQKK